MKLRPGTAASILLLIGLAVLAGCLQPAGGVPPEILAERTLSPQPPGAVGLLATAPAMNGQGMGTAAISYPITGTGQEACYDATGEISCPLPGQAFFGQDAQHTSNTPAFVPGHDNLTVYDTITGLTWQRSPDTNGDGVLTRSDKLTYAQALALPAQLNAEKFGGHDDWRLPAIKELYSLIDFRGTDPVVEATSPTGLTPFIDTRYFAFAYGQVHDQERIIDSQYASATRDVNPGWNGEKLFGVNFADGRIKGYGLSVNGRTGTEKTFFVLCVRGNPAYGNNIFHDNRDGTVTDMATGLMWAQADSSYGMDWEQALAWVTARNAANYLGYNDWRLPDAKELQSIVDYSRSPDSTKSAAIDPVFSCTQITNEAGNPDYPFYWTSTTHLSQRGKGNHAVYISFGRAMGYMNGQWQDVHGVGAQRSDPKIGSPSMYPQGQGPQGDAIRINNFVRLVRTVITTTR